MLPAVLLWLDPDRLMLLRVGHNPTQAAVGSYLHKTTPIKTKTDGFVTNEFVYKIMGAAQTNPKSKRQGPRDAF